MGVVSYITDRLTNVMSGMGTSVDKTRGRAYTFAPLSPIEVEAAYRTSWLPRKIVDIPPLDMTRTWRTWQAEDSDISLIEAEEKRLGLKHKAKLGLQMARLWGGGAMIVGTGDTASDELIPERMGKDGLRYLHVVSRHQIHAGALVADIDSPYFGKPSYYQLGKDNLVIHPSRVIEFVGQRTPGGMVTTEEFWGDPIMQAVQQAVMNADNAQDGFATLIDEAKIDIIKIPEMMAQIGTQEYQDRLLARLAAANAGKSTWRALMLDGAEEWEQRQVSWAGMPDVIDTYLQIVAGAADIPVTRLLGQSPKGLQSNGDGERKDYADMIDARRDEALQPAMDRIDELLIRSALGARPDDIWAKWNPLEQMDAKDIAEIESKRATTIKTYADTALIPDQALADIAKNAMVESGAWPGAEQAFDDAADIEPTEGGDPDLAGEGGDRLEADPPRRAANDAAPRTLYVSRKLVNSAELIKWAKSQGFTTTLPADDMHVTVAYSRDALDWTKVESEDWGQDEDGGITIKPGGVRLVEQFDGGAVVLVFGSSQLSYRHERIKAAGASWDYPDYQPHVTITYDPGEVHVSKVEAYQGALKFGPEIFEELDEDWKSGISER